MKNIIIYSTFIAIALLTTACSTLSLNKTKDGVFYSIRGKCANGYTFSADKEGKSVEFLCQRKDRSISLPSKPSRPNK